MKAGTNKTVHSRTASKNVLPLKLRSESLEEETAKYFNNINMTKSNALDFSN